MSTTPIYDRLVSKYNPRVLISAGAIYSTQINVTEFTDKILALLFEDDILLRYQKETTTKGEHHDTELPAPLVRTSEGKGRCC